MTKKTTILEWVIVLIIIIALLFITMLVVVGTSTTKNLRTSEPLECLPDQCAVSLENGFKTCPKQGQSIIYNPEFEVCNSRYFCDNPTTPNAVQLDGSTNPLGLCPTNVECACTRVATCPNYITSIFNALDGNPYSQLPGQRLSFPQSQVYSTDGTISGGIGPALDNPSSQFCAVSSSWLPLSSCTFLNTITPSMEDIVSCMGMVECNLANGSGDPCSQGVLSLITSESSNITRISVERGIYSCVQGSACPCGRISVFDLNYGSVRCIIPPDN